MASKSSTPTLHDVFMPLQAMKAVAESPDKKTLTVEERNLLSVAYKNVVGSKRSGKTTYRVVF